MIYKEMKILVTSHQVTDPEDGVYCKDRLIIQGRKVHRPRLASSLPG